MKQLVRSLTSWLIIFIIFCSEKIIVVEGQGRWCENDVEWVHYVNGNPDVARGCGAFGYWSADNFARCYDASIQGIDGRTAAEACPKSCERCPAAASTRTSPTTNLPDVRSQSGEQPINDNCASAIRLKVNNPFDSTTQFAEKGRWLGDCGDAYDNGSPGVWFAFLGTGGEVEASLCNEQTLFDTQIFVFSGSCDPGSLVCIDSNDQGCGDQSSVQWPSALNMEYYIFVTGFAVFDVGDFSILITEIKYSKDGAEDVLQPQKLAAPLRPVLTGPCKNDDEWVHFVEGNPDVRRSCGAVAYWSANKFAKCYDTSVQGEDGRTVSEACPESCQLCPSTTASSTISAPSVFTVPCKNDKEWVHYVNGDPNITRGCGAINYWSANKFARCYDRSVQGIDGRTAAEACPESCELCPSYTVSPRTPLTNVPLKRQPLLRSTLQFH